MKTTIPRKRPAPLAGVGGALKALTARGSVGLSETERQFGEQFAAMVGAPFGMPVAGARVGLWHMLAWLKEQGRLGTVLMPALTASIVPNVVRAAGFTVGFVDVHPQTFCSGHEEFLSAVDSNTVAIVATHLEGFPIRVDILAEELRDRDIFIIEDAAHAPGAEVAGRPVGALADAAIFSLGKGKQINAIDGGVVTTTRPELYQYLLAQTEAASAPGRMAVLKKLSMVLSMQLLTRPFLFDTTLWPGVRLFARFGSDPLYDKFVDSTNPLADSGPPNVDRRLGPAQAILGQQALTGFQERAQTRRELWDEWYPLACGPCHVQHPTDGTRPVPLEFAIRCSDRISARKRLRSLGIDSQPTWMVSPHQLSAFQTEAAGRYPEAESLAHTLVYLPFYPDLRTSERARIKAMLTDPPDELRK